ncbi:MAG: hypothetical protein R2752_14190 [Vicinamibacterales bacterium]
MTARRRTPRPVAVAAGLAMLLAGTVLAGAQRRVQGVPLWTPDKPGSDNIEVIAHIPLGPPLSVSDIDIEQDPARPYAYVGRMVYGYEGDRGMDIVDLHDPAHAKVIYRWRIEDQDLHVGTGGMDVKNFKWNNRYYVVQSTQFGQGGPDSDMGAVVLDVTGLPDPSTVKEVARIREPEHKGGFHNIFIYKHSTGRVLLLSTVSGPYAHVYDLGLVVEGKLSEALVAKVPVGPQEGGQRGYHDLYAGYHVGTNQDRFYGGGTGGYYVYDITELQNPRLLVTLTGISGVNYGHTFTPSPDGRYAVAETEYQYAPLRIFDLQPGLDGKTSNVRSPIAAWTADWRNLVHNHEVRWPYVFVSGYLDGLQVFSLEDPTDPVTVAYYDTYVGNGIEGRPKMFNGAFGVDVRNADGLIVVSDMNTGFWAFRMQGFTGWNGADWGMPNISSAQDWDRAPGPMGGRGGGGR